MTQRRWMSAMVIGAVLGACGTALAQDVRQPRGEVPIGTLAHSGSSPFSPPDEDDTLFVADTGSGLDTGCSYRSDGPLLIHFLIKRVVGPVNGDGLLANPARLVANAVVSPRAALILPAFDIDVRGSASLPPEVDRIYLNGHELGVLGGDDGIWKLNQFDVPIEYLKFPAISNTPGLAPAPADNLIEIRIDEASGTDENWCMAVDWIHVEFGAMAPIFLVHGTNAQKSTWKPDFTEFFEARPYPWSYDIDLLPNGGILKNGGLLSVRLRELATALGARKCHIVAHSKGGLDTRAFLNLNYDPKVLKVLSVHTLSTPHHGTIISDIMVNKRNTTNPQSPDPDIQFLIDNDFTFMSWNVPGLGAQTPQEPAISDQMTGSMAKFNQDYPRIPEDILFYNYGAEADLNEDRRIQKSEAVPLLPSFLPALGVELIANAMYSAIGGVMSITVTKSTSSWGENDFTTIEADPAGLPFRQNDLTVTAFSAHAPNGEYLNTIFANHSSIKSAGLAQEIVDRIQSKFPVR